jgi:hypothetical protein
MSSCPNHHLRPLFQVLRNEDSNNNTLATKNNNILAANNRPFGGNASLFAANNSAGIGIPNGLITATKGFFSDLDGLNHPSGYNLNKKATGCGGGGGDDDVGVTARELELLSNLLGLKTQPTAVSRFDDIEHNDNSTADEKAENYQAKKTSGARKGVPGLQAMTAEPDGEGGDSDSEVEDHDDEVAVGDPVDKENNYFIGDYEPRPEAKQRRRPPPPGPLALCLATEQGTQQ